MPGGIVVPRFGFYNHVQAVLGITGQAASGNITFDLAGVVGCAVVSDTGGNGAIISGIHGSVDTLNFGGAPNLRLVICSLASNPQALAALIQTLPPEVGAIWNNDGSPNFDAGMYLPDLTSLVPNLVASGGVVTANVRVAGAPNSLNIHCDELIPSSTLGRLTFTTPITIPANYAVAGLFIAARGTDGGAPTFNQSPGCVVRGALEGRLATAAEVAAQSGITPARSGNVFLPGSLSQPVRK